MAETPTLLSVLIAAYESTAAENGHQLPPCGPLLKDFDSSHLEELCPSPRRANNPSEFVWLVNGNIRVPQIAWRKEEPLAKERSSADSSSEAEERVVAGAKQKRKNRRRGGKKASKGPNSRIKKMQSLFAHMHKSSPIFQSPDVSVMKHGSRASTGWSGLQPLQAARKQVVDAWDGGLIGNLVCKFVQIPYESGCNRPALVADSDRSLFLVRTSIAEWLSNRSKELCDAIDLVLRPTLDTESGCQDGVRGPHLAFIMGHHRQYTQGAALTEWQRKNAEACERFLQTPVVAELINWVNSLLGVYFPAIARRYSGCVEWHAKNSGFTALFGNFFNFCINAAFPGQDRVHCRPHTDWKNVVGVCILVVYQLPGTSFDHTRFSWLVIWEAGVIIELPPWVALLYPSSLFFHFNVDVSSLRIVTTKDRVEPTPDNSDDITNRSSHGRGSLVFFNQASMFQSSETNSRNLAEAKAKGHTGVADYSNIVLNSFTKTPG